jgi:hypothetical protein
MRINRKKVNGQIEDNLCHYENGAVVVFEGGDLGMVIGVDGFKYILYLDGCAEGNAYKLGPIKSRFKVVDATLEVEE